MMGTTICWRCNEIYPLEDRNCPNCEATNGNIDPIQAQIELKNTPNEEFEYYEELNRGYAKDRI